MVFEGELPRNQYKTVQLIRTQRAHQGPYVNFVSVNRNAHIVKSTLYMTEVLVGAVCGSGKVYLAAILLLKFPAA